ncbi:membrane integrity-associated transporter subunit PqiC [Cupriavidus sp. AU9028]|uniref:PqiC family protein n=1 Tax=Cupriavidus sp. AU9028 TaxID=2871157 RepID=UPI001C9839B4|nr:PqiC family protein [Cupriavidus sp. AU9028]MBY4895508.1 PqiC family protein [Cupriavidus sp. AU9028]
MTRTAHLLSRPLLRLLAGAAAALALAACGTSSEPRYYTLAESVPPSGAATSAPAEAQPVWIEVTPVRVPERLNRQHLVIDEGNGRQRRLESSRWSAPLPDEMRDALSQRLQVALGAVDIYQRGLADAQPLYRVSTEVVRMDAGQNDRVLALVNWTVRRVPDGPAQSGRMQAELPAPGGVDGVVGAYRAALDATTAQIAAAITAQHAARAR